MSAPVLKLVLSLQVALSAIGGAPIVDQVIAQEAARETALAPTTSRVNQVIIDAIAAANPQTATAVMRAVNNLVNIDEFDLARGYLEQASKLPTSDREFHSMVDEFGPAFFIRLSLRRQLQPLIEQYTQRAFAGANRVVQDPRQLVKWVRQLDDDSVDTRQTGLNKLRAAGPHGAAAILRELSDPKSNVDQKKLERALVQFGPDAKPVLIAALRSQSDGAPFFALKALRQTTQLDSQEVIPDLLRWCYAEGVSPEIRRHCSAQVTSAFGKLPSRDAAVEYLTAEIRRLLQPDSLMLPADLQGASQLWFWRAGHLEQRSYPQSIAQLIRGTQLAADLFMIDGQSSESRLLFAATQIGSGKIAGSLTRPLDLEQDSIVFVRQTFTPEELETVLAFCLDLELAPSAIGTLELLAEFGTENNLGYEASRSAIANALRYPDRRIQFAAVRAIMHIGPRSAFNGSCELVHVLSRFAASNGHRRVLVVHPIRAQADLIANTLPNLGFQADVVTNGKQALDCLLKKSDYDVILVGDSVSSPKWTELVQHLRAQAPQTPICILARGFHQGLALEVAIRHPRMTVYPLPYDADSVAALLRTSLPDATDRLTTSERREYALESLKYLAQLASIEHQDMFELGLAEPVVHAALTDLTKVAAAIPAAAELGTPALQAALVDLASDPSQSSMLRQSAIEALDRAVSKRGLLLTTDTLRSQYRRFNQAVDLGAEDIQTFGKLLDSMERPSGISSRVAL